MSSEVEQCTSQWCLLQHFIQPTAIVTTLSNMKTSILRDKEMDIVFSVRCVPALNIPSSPLYQMLLQCFKGGALTLRRFNIHMFNLFNIIIVSISHTCMLVQLICRPFHTKEDLCVSCLLSMHMLCVQLAAVLQARVNKECSSSQQNSR